MSLSPEIFWSLTLCEWRWLAGGASEQGASGAPARAEIEALALLYPDERR